MQHALPQGAPIKSNTYLFSLDNFVPFGKVLGSIRRRTTANCGVIGTPRTLEMTPQSIGRKRLRRTSRLIAPRSHLANSERCNAQVDDLPGPRKAALFCAGGSDVGSQSHGNHFKL